MSDFRISSRYETDWYRPNEGSTTFMPPTGVAGKIPTVYAHGAFGVAVNARTQDNHLDEFKAICGASGRPLLFGDLGGQLTFANPDSIDAFEDILTAASERPGLQTRTDRVAVYGISMGAALALNWGWRNPGRVASMVITTPLVNFQHFHDDGSFLVPNMEAAYGGLAGWTAALDTHAPERNWDLIRPFADRLTMYYAPDDGLIRAADCIEFADETGCAVVVGPPGADHDWGTMVPPDDVSYRLLKTYG